MCDQSKDKSKQMNVISVKVNQINNKNPAKINTQYCSFDINEQL